MHGMAWPRSLNWQIWQNWQTLLGIFNSSQWLATEHLHGNNLLEMEGSSRAQCAGRPFQLTRLPSRFCICLLAGVGVQTLRVQHTSAIGNDHFTTCRCGQEPGVQLCLGVRHPLPRSQRQAKAACRRGHTAICSINNDFCRGARPSTLACNDLAPIAIPPQAG